MKDKNTKDSGISKKILQCPLNTIFQWSDKIPTLKQSSVWSNTFTHAIQVLPCQSRVVKGWKDKAGSQLKPPRVT